MADVLIVFDEPTAFDANYQRYIRRFLPSSLSHQFIFCGNDEGSLKRTIKEINPKVVLFLGYFKIEHIEETYLKETYLVNNGLKNILQDYFTKRLTTHERHGIAYPITLDDPTNSWNGWITSTFHPRWLETYPGNSALPVFQREMDRLKELVNNPPKQWNHDEIKEEVAHYFETHECTIDDLYQMAPEVACDIETSGLSPFDSHFLSIAFSDGERHWCITHHFLADHDDEGNILHDNFPIKEIVEFMATRKKVVVHNLAFELLWFRAKYGQSLPKIQWHDTMAKKRLVRENLLGLEDCVFEEFGFLLEGKKDRGALIEYSPFKLKLYNTLDTVYTFFLDLIYDIPSEEEYSRLIRLVETLIEMEERGLFIDKNYLKEISEKFEKEVEEIEAELMKYSEVQSFTQSTGKEFNPLSPVQIKKIFEMNEVEAENTQEATLQKLDLDWTNTLCELRKSKKNLKTYVKNINKFTYADGYMHPEFKPYFTTTGRLAASKPSVQNFPKRKDSTVRGVVVPRRGEIMAAIDYAQLEARVFGMVTQDQYLISQLKQGFDIHGHWADRLLDDFPAIYRNIKKEFGIEDKKEIRKYIRTNIKTSLVFSTLYGAHYSSCLRRLQNMTATRLKEKMVQRYSEEIFESYPAIRKWQSYWINFYNKYGYVEGITHRRRFGPMTKNEYLNSLIQGPASDIVTRAMCLLTELSIAENKPYLTPILNIHDDLTFSIPLLNMDGIIKEITTVMLAKNYDWMIAPIEVEVTTGPRWNRLEDYGKFSSTYSC